MQLSLSNTSAPVAGITSYSLFPVFDTWSVHPTLVNRLCVCVHVHA
jgi:hypothetical protein